MEFRKEYVVINKYHCKILLIGKNVLLSTEFLSSNILQPSDSFFASKNKEIVETGKVDILQKNKHSFLLDSDNNNGNSQTQIFDNFTHLNHSSKFPTQQQKNDSKQIYKNLKSFDPLNSGNNLWFF